MSTGLQFRGRRIWCAALLLTGLASLAWSQGGGFVQSLGGALTLDGAPFRFGGTNAAGLMMSDRATVDQVLETAQSDNLKVVRVWVFCDGIQCDGGQFYLQYWNSATGAPAYNDTTTGLANVDYTIAEAGKLGIKLIVTLTDNWTYFGGMDTYVTWRGLKDHDQFYTDSTILQWYENWVSHVLNHVNTITGVAYKDDPAIMAWELANEPECGNGNLPTSNSCNVQTLVDWIGTASAYIKTVDQNHLVAVGDEGFICPAGNCSNGVDSSSFSQVSTIDIAGFHLYPDSWNLNLAEAATFIADQESIAAKLGKPVYMGEFGIESGNGKEAVFNDWMNLIFSGGASGAMFWDLASGTTAASAAETYYSWDEHAGAPALMVMNNSALTMAGSAQQFPPVAGYQWATAAFGEPVTLDVVANDVAYGGATIDFSTIDLDPNTPGQQMSLTVDGGVFNVVNGTIQFTPNPGYAGTAQGSYTVADSNSQLSNVGYLFVTVNPVQTDWGMLESFESGTGGWGPEPNSSSAGTVATSTNFNTDGKHSLQVNVTGGGWFGVTFPTPVSFSVWPSVEIDILTTSAGTSVEFAFQSGSGSVWCQGNAWPQTGLFSITTLSLELQPSAFACYGSSADLNSVTSLYVYLGTPGTYYLDNIRLGPGTSEAAPLPTITGVANAAGSQVGVSAGTYLSIYGSNFAPASSEWVPWSNYVTNGQLPTSLAGVSVSIGGMPAYVEFVSPGQINVLAPNVGTGSTTVTVTTPAGISKAYAVTSAAVQPAFFQWGTYAVATDAGYNLLAKNGTLNTPTVPAKPGEIIILWGTGFGPTTPAAPSGQATPSGSYSVSGVGVTVGGLPAQVLETALSPGSAGLYQVNITLPASLANGDYPVVATVGGVQSPSGVELTVQQ
jgi:mannan endo-1,4-beta-mannosidase